MILFPAIDLKDGQCVRLYKGDMSEATVFSDNPAKQAENFQSDGAAYLHLVDLDGAFAGHARNRAAVEAILARIAIPVQLGGGIRDMEAIQRWIERGIARVILGTVALRDPDLVRRAAVAFPGQIAVGVDARGGMVATEGWAKTSTTSALDLAGSFEDAGVSALIYTDIARDGAMAGPNVAATRALAEAVSIPVIASGGIATLNDLVTLRTEIPALSGAIVGRALYENAFSLTEARAALEAPQC